VSVLPYTDRVAEALAGNPELIRKQIQEHQRIVAEQQEEIGKWKRVAHLRQQAIDLLTEDLQSKQATIEEVEVNKLATLLEFVHDFVVTADLPKPTTLMQLMELDRYKRAALEIHRAMRGKSSLRALCQNCRKAACGGCGDDTRATDEMEARLS
jgi:hypothetical protein